MWPSLTNTTVRGVALALTVVALLGFYLGIRGALPSGGPISDPGLPAITTTGPVQEVQPIQEAIAPPPAAEPKEEAANAAANAAADEPEEEAPPAPKVYARPLPQTNSIEPADPIGNLIAPAPKPEEAPILY